MNSDLIKFFKEFIWLRIFLPCIFSVAGEYEAMFDGCEDFEEDGMEGAEVHCCEEVQSSMNLSQPDECTGGNRDSSKRLSKDSGTGSDIEQDSLRGYTQKSLAAAGRTLDSGEEGGM